MLKVFFLKIEDQIDERFWVTKDLLGADLCRVDGNKEDF